MCNSWLNGSVVIIFPVIFETFINLKMLSIGSQGVGEILRRHFQQFRNHVTCFLLSDLFSIFCGFVKMQLI